MPANVGITLYHQSVNKATRLKEWAPKYYPNVSIKEDVISTVTDGGLKSANIVKIRIMTEKVVQVAKGDKVALGSSSSTTPPDGAYSVIAFSNNRRGSKNRWHWKVICS